MGNAQARLEDREPFEVEDTTDLPPEVIQVWKEVAMHVKSGTQVPLESAKSALEFLKEFLGTHEQALQFVEHYMDCLVETIFSQDSPKEESDESQYVEECLKLSAVIIVKNINLQLLEDGSLESTSTVLTKLFSDDNKYYQENEGRRTRYKVINTFHVQGGFSSLVEYIASRQLATSSRAIEFLELVVRTVYELAVAKDTHGAPEEPVKSDRGVTSTDIRALTILGTLPRSSSDFEASLSSSPRLQAAEPAIVESIVSMPDFSASRDSRKKDAVCVTNAIVVGFIRHISFQQLRVQSLETLKALLDKLEFILMGTRSVQSTQEDMEEYANVIRGLVLQTITSNRVELKDFGWDRIRDLVYVAERYRPPPKNAVVSNAAHGVANGTFTFMSQSSDFCTTVFEKRGALEGVGRNVYLYSVQRKGRHGYIWVIVSCRHGSVDRHYIAESTSYTEPPSNGWRHLNPDGKGSLPTLRCIGFATSSREETNTLGHQLVKWAHDNKIISLLCNEPRDSKFIDRAMHVSYLVKLMSFMNKRCDEENHSTHHRLSPSHLLPVWDLAIKSDDEDESSNLISLLVVAFPHLPDDIALPLLRVLRDCLHSHWSRCFEFFYQLVRIWDGSSRSLCVPFMSKVIRTETKKLMWIIRTLGSDDTDMLETTKEFHRDWFKWESTNLHDAHSTRDAPIPLKPKVSVLDPKTRLIEVSLPIESLSGEYYMAIFIHSSCDTYENGEEVLLAIIPHSDIEQCLEEDECRVNVQVCLPEEGLWSLEWRGVLLREEPFSTPQFKMTTVDLTTGDKELMKRHREEVSATDELAKKHAGDIQSTIRKLRGPSSSKMTIESRFSLLNTAVTGGRSALNKLRCLMATYESDDESVSGIVSLENALAEAQLPMAELEALLKARNNKERIKSFKAHATALLKNGEIATWLDSAQENDLNSLGGDSNRLYQLLVEAKTCRLNAAAIETASTRADLFSKKQIKTLLSLSENFRRTSRAGKVNEKPTKSFTAEPVPSQQCNVKQSLIAPAPSFIAENFNSKDAWVNGTSHLSKDSSLLKFLKEQADCLKGSPDAFHRWLVNSEDISSLKDLADAVTDDHYLQDVLHQNGLKGFKRAAFKKAVLVATDRCHKDACERNKENERQPPSKLVCPLSGVLMTDQPVIAADGFTYELVAIAEWFEKQNQEVEAAKELIAAGNKSKELQSIVDRGIFSPVTRAKMDSLSLAPNKTVQTMARDVAKVKKRTPFGSVS